MQYCAIVPCHLTLAVVVLLLVCSEVAQANLRWMKAPIPPKCTEAVTAGLRALLTEASTPHAVAKLQQAVMEVYVRACVQLVAVTQD